MGCCITEAAVYAEGHTVEAETLGRAAYVLLSSSGDTTGLSPNPAGALPQHIWGLNSSTDESLQVWGCGDAWALLLRLEWQEECTDRGSVLPRKQEGMRDQHTARHQFVSLI